MKRIFRIFLSIFFRALLPLVFFVGGASMILWAQGWRFDLADRTLVPTGVLSVTSTPEQVRVFVGGKPLGVTPQIFLGIPVGKSYVCLQKTGYQTLCSEAEFTSKLAYRIRNVHLLPQFPRPRIVGPADLIRWDPAARGFIRFYPELKDAAVYNGRSFTFLNNVTFDPESVISHQGQLLSLSVPPVPLFPDAAAPDSSGKRFLEHGYLFIKDTELFFYEGANDRQTFLARFDEPIEDVFFLPGSESAIVALPSSIHFLQRIGEHPVRLFSKDPAFPLRYFSQSASIFWKEGESIFTFTFAPQNIL